MDNDCDDEVDEGDAVDAKSWYRDCDDDGFASDSQASNPTRACNEPPAENGCAGWVELEPSSPATTDCNDGSLVHHPGADYAYPWNSREEAPEPGSMEYDLNCDRQLEQSANLYVAFDLLGSDKVMLGACDEPDQNDIVCCYYGLQAVASGCGYSLKATLDCALAGAGGIFQAEVSGYYVCK